MPDDTPRFVTGYGQQFFADVEAAYGKETADAVRFASLPDDEKIHILEHRRNQIRDELDAMVSKWPELKSQRPGGRSKP
jgi:hypothetical protein